uniref:Dynamin-type G domain-containing protein n=1 Tax=Anopheles coluzzii TaxID=1518534 RepID=A0A8W7PSU5_ANOCL
MRRLSVWVLLGLALFTLSTAGLQVQAETPTEYECRPYIEKAIQDLKSESAEAADEENASIEHTIDVTSQEEEDNTAAEEVSTEETDTAADDATEEITPSEEVQEQLFADTTEDEATDNVEASEETEQEAADSEEGEEEQAEDQEENVTEEAVQSEETAEPTVSEEAEQSEEVPAETEELTSEESANQVLEDATEEEEDEEAAAEDDGEQDEEEDVATEEVTESAEEEATDSQEAAADAAEDQEEEEEDEEDETSEDVADQTKSEESDVDDDGEEEKEENDDDEEETHKQSSSEDEEDDDLDEENAAKGSYDDREQEDVEDASAEANEASEEVVASSEDTTEQTDNDELEGTNSEEQETTTEGSDEASLTDAVSGEETESEDEPASQEEADEDAADDENLSEETDNETVDETATSEEENAEAEPASDEQLAVDSQEEQEDAAQDEPSTEEPAEESTEDATAASEEGSQEQQEADSAEEATDSQQVAEDSSAEETVTESTEQEAGVPAEGESEEETVVKQDSEESLPADGEASVEQSAEESETASQEEEKEESFPEEDLLLEYEIPTNLRDTTHVYELLNINDDASSREKALQETADVILRDLKRIYDNSIKPLETLYKYRDLSNRHFGDPEIFSKPLVLFMGPWSGGKSTILNYLTHNEYTPNSVRTGAEPSPAYFNILMHGDEPEVLDGTQLAADWTFSGLQKFGQGLLDRLRGQKLPNKLLERVNIVEIPGILEVRKQVSKYFPFNDACQWFIDRADIIFLVYDPSKLDVGPETEAILDQLKGREYQTRILLNKADQVKPEELLRVQSALIWNISPLMSSAQPPVMYTVSLWSNPYEVGAPVRLLQAQERSLLLDLGQAIDRRIENKIASARRFAVRVRNHAKMVDCYLTTYYNHKTLFGNKKQTAEKIIASPQDYHIYEGLSTLTNISRYDLPDPEVYRDFFHLNPLYEFKKLSETCTYFRGCPINKLDVAIAYDLPELVGKYKKMAEAALAKLDVLTPTSDFGKGKSNS